MPDIITHGSHFETRVFSLSLCPLSLVLSLSRSPNLPRCPCVLVAPNSSECLCHDPCHETYIIPSPLPPRLCSSLILLPAGHYRLSLCVSFLISLWTRACVSCSYYPVTDLVFFANHENNKNANENLSFECRWGNTRDVQNYTLSESTSLWVAWMTTWLIGLD